MQVLANLLSLAGVCPFVGSLSDLIGRRYVAIIGASLICLGMIVSSTAHNMNVFIGMFLRETQDWTISDSFGVKPEWQLPVLVLASMN